MTSKNTQLIKIEVLPQQMGEGFDELMDEAYRQQRVALAAPDLLSALKDCERIISFALYNHQLEGQNRFDAEHSISGIRAAIAKARVE